MHFRSNLIKPAYQTCALNPQEKFHTIENSILPTCILLLDRHLKISYRQENFNNIIQQFWKVPFNLISCDGKNLTVCPSFSKVPLVTVSSKSFSRNSSLWSKSMTEYVSISIGDCAWPVAQVPYQSEACLCLHVVGSKSLKLMFKHVWIN